MNEITQQIVSACVPVLCLLITAGGGYLVALLRKQTEQLQQQFNNDTASKYIKLACDAAEQAVTYTAQTFVDALKAEGGFTKEKQHEAYRTARDVALIILGKTAEQALYEIFDDFETWLDTRIEMECRKLKGPTASAKTE